MSPFDGFDLSARLVERFEIVLEALNQEFGWSLPSAGSVLPGPVIGGHANLFFTKLGTPAAFHEIIGEPGDAIFPPGHRLPIRLSNIEGIWALHIPQACIEADHVSGHAHLDRGDPDRDVCGIITHVGYDFLWTHLLHRSDIDPRRL